MAIQSSHPKAITDNYKGHIAILSANIIFGANIPVSKIVIPGFVSSYALAFYRTMGAFLFFWMVSFFMKKEKVPARDVLRFAIASVFGVMFNQMLFVMGLEYASPLDAAIVVTFTPIMTMLLSSLFLREPITWLKAAGVFLGLSGAFIMIGGKYWFGGEISAQGKNSVLGIILCLVSGLSYAIYLTAFRNLVARYKPVTVMKWMFLFSAIFTLPFLWKYVSSIDYAALPVKAYASLAYTVLGATCLTYILIPIGQKNLRPTVLSVYNYVQPVTATTLALILGQDRLTWITVLSTLLVFTGVFLVTRSKSRAQLEQDKVARQKIWHWPRIGKVR